MMMGDLRVCSLPSGGGVLRRNNHFCSGICSLNSDPALIAEENWIGAEEAAREVLYTVHPTVEANCRRKEVTEYVRGLIKSSLGFEVFPYGSVPLKTYLPDGDIDLTAISSPTVEDAMFSDVHAVLKREEQNRDARCEVKDVHFIDAEVKLVKCIVQNMVVDISFNQLGGLSTLCFLEQVDRLVGKDHLLKRSIILIKSWCYYESRILGAHHGLISTYALETLILYIFNLFHSSLDGPFAVLYRFLDYYSKFDWDKYCVSLNGPVCKTSLPNIVVGAFEIGRGKLLLKDEFLWRCVDMFSVPSKNVELNSRPFPQKHLNIVDPLKANNNLGRSVNRGNYYRIRSAFRYGARKLGQILSLPSERMSYELNKFFSNTLDLDRHRSHVEDFRVLSCPRISDNSSSSSSSSSSEDGKSTLSCSVDKSRNAFTFLFYRKASSISCALQSECKENHIMINNSACSSTNNHGDEASFVSSKSLMDLTGDYDSQFRSLLCGQYSHFYALPSHMPSYTIKNPWQTIRESLKSNQKFHPQNYRVPFSEAFSHDENKERRGTGTYIPNTLYYTNEDRLSSGRGKNQGSGLNVEKGHGSASTDNNSNDLSEAEYPYLGNGKPTVQSSSWSFCCENSRETDIIDQAMHLLEEYSTDVGCSPIETAEPILENDTERVELESYHLRDEVDFPPLSLGR